MRFLDFHCDTAGECFLQQKPLWKNDLHIDLSRASCFSAYAQVFAIWIPDEKRGDAAFQYYRDVLENFRTEVQKNAAHIAICETGRDLQTVLQQQKTAAVLAVEGGAVLGGRLEKLDQLYRDGVRLMTLTWNGDNEIASGCFSETNGGLTPFGQRVVDKMREKRMLVDVSHLNERGFYEVAERLDAPFLASHSNAKIVDNPYAAARNLTDDQIRTLIRLHGLIGINLCADFLGNNGDTGFDAVLRHISHFLELGADACLAFGCDFDGCTVHESLNGIEHLPELFSYLLQHGISEPQLENIFFENGLAFLVANL